MKLENHENGTPTGMPGIRLKFYANKTYSHIFEEGIKRVIEEFDGRYTGCYGCGRCKGDLEGYVYHYANGRDVFRCGSELIAIQNCTPENLDEIKHLMKTQDHYWMKGEKALSL